MATQCYALVRGSAIRVTGLDSRGALPDSIPYVVSKSIVKVSIDEVTDSGGAEMLRNDEDARRVLLRKPDQTIRYVAGINFIRVDPGLISLLTGFPLVSKPQEGQFGIDAFGVFPFGGGESTDYHGFDAVTKLRPASFALEVWTKMAGAGCAGQWGYSLFPFLKGGRLSGFSYDNGLVSFSLVGAQTRRKGKWGRGPYDLNGVGQRLVDPVSGNANWRQTIVTSPPPAQTDGIVTFQDVIEGGSASTTSSDVIDGGTASMTTSGLIDGGAA